MPFEGWLVRLIDEVWLVRGYEHPPGRLIVAPYRHGTSRYGTRQVLRPEFLECTGRTVLTIRRGEGQLIDPSEALRRASIPLQVRELIDVIDPDWSGLTGSYAIGLQRPDSDVDILVFSPKPHAIYKALGDLKERGLIADCRQDLRYAKERDSFTYEEFLALHPLKLLDSCYKGVPYTLRILRLIDERPCESRFTPLGWIRVVGRVMGTESYLTPAVYEVEGDFRLYLMTWRTRYQELPRGKYLISGLLQRDEVKGSLYVVPDLGGYVRPLEIRSR